MKRICAILTSAVMCCIMTPAAMLNAAAIDYSKPAESECYGGNIGDSFIDVIGTRNGNTTVDGITYTEGIELWVARWNYKDEKSWVWASYETDPSMTEFTGTLSVLKNSYNIQNYNTTLEISLDGAVVYTYTMTPGFEPQEINIPLDGASEITFSVYDNEAVSGGTSFCIGTGVGYRLGDVDLNGTVDAIDASLVLTAYANQAVGQSHGLKEVQIKAADVNMDGSIDALDASLILGYYAYTATGGEDAFEDFLK